MVIILAVRMASTMMRMPMRMQLVAFVVLVRDVVMRMAGASPRKRRQRRLHLAARHPRRPLPPPAFALALRPDLAFCFLLLSCPRQSSHAAICARHQTPISDIVHGI
eukprot:3488326-Rhodomonas_salina.2